MEYTKCTSSIVYTTLTTIIGQVNTHKEKKEFKFKKHTHT